MSKTVPARTPEAYGLASFADILPARDPIVGEDPGSFDEFHRGMMRSLAPFTPYECVVAENLVAIEWELLQHRRMRDADLRRIIHVAIRKAVIREKEYDHEAEFDRACEAHFDAGGSEEEWKEPRFDGKAAGRAGDDLAERAISRDPEEQASAYAEITALGMDPVEIMGEAYRSYEEFVVRHEEKIRELEQRRREVKRDFDALQRTRPVEAEVMDP